MSGENDVPLGEGSRRYYEQQFGDRIRQVKKGGRPAPSDGGDGPKWQRGAGCGGVLAVFFLIRIVIVLVGSRSNTPSYNYTPPSPPDFDVGLQQDLNDLLKRPPFPPAVQEDEKALLTDEDVPLWEGLCYRIHQESLRLEATPGGHIMKLLDPDARPLLVKSARGQALDGNERAELLDGLNEVLERADFWEPAAFRKVPAVQKLLRDRKEVFRGEELPRRALERRRVLELCYPLQIVPMDERSKLDGPARDQWRKRARLDLEQARREYEPGKR